MFTKNIKQPYLYIVYILAAQYLIAGEKKNNSNDTKNKTPLLPLCYTAKSTSTKKLSEQNMNINIILIKYHESLSFSESLLSWFVYLV